MNAVWRIPAALACLTVAGLAAGLVGDGPWDGAGAAALAFPLAAAAWRGRR